MPKAPIVTLTTPSDREVAMTRVVNAPRALAFEAWTDAKHVPHWMLGPEGWTMPVCEIDLRTGGRWRMVWRKDQGTEMAMSGIYQDVKAPERVVSTERWGADWPETINTVTFVESGGTTTITLSILYPNREARDRAMETGMQEGMVPTFNRLEARLATMKSKGKKAPPPKKTKKKGGGKR